MRHWETSATASRSSESYGIEVLQGMMEEDVAVLAGERHERAPDKPGYRWRSTVSRFDCHGSKVPLDRHRVHDKNAGRRFR